MSGEDIIAVSMGMQHTIILKSTGEILVFGSNLFGQCGLGEQVQVLEKPRVLMFDNRVKMGEISISFSLITSASK